MTDHSQKQNVAKRLSHSSDSFRQAQVAELLITADRLGLHLVTAAMLYHDRSGDEETQHGCSERSRTVYPFAESVAAAKAGRAADD
jgi:hypothetical protein